MQTDKTALENKFVALASIAAELYSVMHIAWGVSIAAKNAKVISAQAGNKGLGFQPITDFIDEISQITIHGVNAINKEALHLSKLSVAEQRTIDALQRFQAAASKASGAPHLQSIEKATAKISVELHQIEQEFTTTLRKLIFLLDDMDKHMLSARAIASVSRIVTSGAQEYRSKLSVVSDDLDEAAAFIKQKVADSNQHLDRVRKITRQQLQNLHRGNV